VGPPNVSGPSQVWTLGWYNTGQISSFVINTSTRMTADLFLPFN
jgi:hypothetical protein